MFQSQPCPGVAGAGDGVEAPAGVVVTEASSAWASATGSSEGPSCKPAPKAAAAEAGLRAVLAAAVTLKASFVVAFLVTVHPKFHGLHVRWTIFIRHTSLRNASLYLGPQSELTR